MNTLRENIKKYKQETGLPLGLVEMELKPDGKPTKVPCGVKGWQRPENRPNIEDWPQYKKDGACLFTGHGIEVLDVDTKNWKEGGDFNSIFLSKFRELSFFDKLIVYTTYHDGLQLPYHCSEIEGNQKLATRAGHKEALIETRGNNGYAVCPPSDRYEFLQGDWSNLPTLTPKERQELFGMARSFDQSIPIETIKEFKQAKLDVGNRPGDQWAKQTNLLDYLLGHGWTISYKSGEEVFLTRPDKDFGVSATYNYMGLGGLYVFTTSTTLPSGELLTPFAVKAYLEYGGDFRACARELAAQGYEDFSCFIDEPMDALDNDDVEPEEKEAEVLPDIDLEPLPPLLKNYLLEISGHTDAPRAILLSSVLVTLSSCVKRGVVYKDYFGDELSANIWMLSVAKSGGFKTTALNKGSKLGDELELDYQLPSDATYEGLFDLQLANGIGGGLFLSEFGAWANSLLKEHNRGLKENFTDLYDCPRVRKRLTKKDGEKIAKRPFISICAVSTMDWIRSTLSANADVASGFLARFLLLYPPVKDVIPPALPIGSAFDETSATEAYVEHIKKVLEKITGDPLDVMLDKDAEIAFQEFHKEIHKERQRRTDQVWREPYTKRWSPHTIKLAMLINLTMKGDLSVVKLEAMKAAISIVKYAMASTEITLDKLGSSTFHQKAEEVKLRVYDRMKKHRKATWGWLLQSKILAGGSKDYQDVVQYLVESGSLLFHEVNGKPKKAWVFAKP
jgi:hypothetical protein